MKIRRDKRMWLAVLGVFALVFGVTFLIQKINDRDVDAANMGAFEAGYIISDFQMGNYNSMNEAHIQAFLKSKNNCNDTATWKSGNNVGYLSETAPYSWHVAGGHYVCMADENFNGESAAHIIWQAAQDYKINPQVLIVLLQKEQGLVTDTFPNSVQYRSAMGYGCPDTAACSTQYYGFKNQVRNAAALFRTVLDGGWTNYPVGNNYVRYNPNAACGGTTVNIRNRATSALYRYTPYQPNGPALSSSYGGGDGCSAYGNRNFYSYFEDWFGNIKWDGWQDLSVVMSHNRVAKENTDQGLTYRTHIEHYGWLGWVSGGAMAGTAGYNARVEGLQIKLTDGLTGIEYRTHVQDVGWTDYVADGVLSGTTGQSRRVEAVQIRLTGEIAKRFDVYYRTHVQNIGWTSWVKNDVVSGTTGKSLRVEAVQVKLVLKDLNMGPEYVGHVQDIGWMNWVDDARIAGTTGQSKRVESIKIKLPKEIEENDGIQYRVHVQNIGWMNWVKSGELAGTTGRSLRLEAIQIKLSDELATKYDIYYRVHAQDYGWMKWVKNGEQAGTTGQSKRLEAVQIELVKK
ncbi:hypothetical protein IKF21_01190 [Candidatus Saccharibacteria bacterium]|nr:hypothetical protein [Candidatus Saccharibacteria bacterium]